MKRKIFFCMFSLCLSCLRLHVFSGMDLTAFFPLVFSVGTVQGLPEQAGQPPAQPQELELLQRASSSEWFTYTSDLEENSSASGGHSRSTESVNQPGEQAMPPALPVMQEAANEEDRPIFWNPDYLFGGDSKNSIQRRLLSQSHNPSAQDIYLAGIQAEDLFQVKVDIIRQMATLDPEGDWLGRGARALDNPRTKTGEESLANLYKLRDELAQRGISSPSFGDLKMKVFRRLIDRHPHR